MEKEHPELADLVAKTITPKKGPGGGGGRGGPSPQEMQAPYVDSVYDAGLWLDGSQPDYTMLVIKPGEPRDLPVYVRGTGGTGGEIVPRRFLTVLAKNPGQKFTHGSGRLDLAESIVSDAAPLTARVIVNRIWGENFGTYLVGTPSDFGDRGDKPTNPELLDDLTARFIANGWSIKWLQREILLSATYRQSSRPRPDAKEKDEANALQWRMNPRRLDIEAYRDTLLRSAGTLDTKMYGPSIDLEASGNTRRTLYARISRARLNDLLRIYDFPSPMQHSPSRVDTMTPLQQLFVMNSPFIEQLAATLAGPKETNAAANITADRVRDLYRKILGRDPSGAEIDSALTYLNHAPLARFTQTLLATNEEILAMMTRRNWISSLAGGLGGVALSDILAGEARAATSGIRPVGTDFTPKAKHVISLFMTGGPSQLDMFDPKPSLVKYAGQRPGEVDLRTERKTGGLLPSPFAFKKYGRGGIDISELLPKLSECADDLCVVKSMYSFIANHEPGRNLYFTGSIVSFRPSMGSWVTYGLGTENQNLPAFVALTRRRQPLLRLRLSAGEVSGHRHQQLRFRPGQDDPYLRNKEMDKTEQRAQLDFLQSMNKSHEASFGQDAFLEGRIQSMEQAYRMQFTASDVFDIKKEPQSVRDEYGDSPYGTGCLLARRLIENGVRYVQVHYGPGQPWDDHKTLNKNLRERCPEMDKASAALIKDLKQRGLLDETLVVWGGELGAPRFRSGRWPRSQSLRLHHVDGGRRSQRRHGLRRNR